MARLASLVPDAPPRESAATISEPDEIAPEYDFSDAPRGVFYERATGRPLPIELDPDVRAVFRDEKSVNEALRTLIRLKTAVRGGPEAP